MDEIRRLEAENRVLENNFQDLEFQLEEMRVKNENLSTLKKRLRDLEIELEYANFLVEQKQLDLEFIDAEIEKLQADEESTDAKARLQEQLEEMNQEIEQNRANLEVLQNEERAAMENIRDRERNFESAISNKPLPNGWIEDRDSHMEKREELSSALEHEKEMLNEVKMEFEKLQKDRFEGTDMDGEEVLRALTAELMYTKIDPIHNAINCELEYRETLERELEMAKHAAKSVKKYRDRVIERHELQFELASLQSRLESLQEHHL